MANGRGGKRPGAGRKPNVLRQARQMALDAADPSAEHALDFVIGLVDNWKAGYELRLRAAQTVMDRVWGKATEKHEGNADIVLRVIYGEGTLDPLAPLSPGPDGGAKQPGETQGIGGGPAVGQDDAGGGNCS